jgi:hypothetical protein
MTRPKPLTEREIRAKCQAIITAGVRHAYEAALSGLSDLEARLGLEIVEPVMAAAFSESIESRCQVLGIVTNGVPDVGRFIPHERHAFALLPATIPLQTLFDSSQFHAVMARRVRTYLTARARWDREQAGAVYRRVATTDQVGNFVFMLWATAVIVQRRVEANAAIGRACPICRDGVLRHLESGRSAVYTCGHLESLNDFGDSGIFRASQQQMFAQVSTILGNGGSQ